MSSSSIDSLNCLRAALNSSLDIGSISPIPVIACLILLKVSGINLNFNFLSSEAMAASIFVPSTTDSTISTGISAVIGSGLMVSGLLTFFKAMIKPIADTAVTVTVTATLAASSLSNLSFNLVKSSLFAFPTLAFAISFLFSSRYF